MNLFGELGKAPTDQHLAKEACVGNSFAGKIKKDVQERKMIITMNKLKEERWSSRQKEVQSICVILPKQHTSFRVEIDYCPTSFGPFFIGPFHSGFSKTMTVLVNKYKPSNIVT